MLETIIPIIKYLFYNYDYFLILLFLTIFLLVKNKPDSYLGKKIIRIGNNIYNNFIKLTEINIFALLLIFFIINFLIRFLMMIPVPEIYVMQDIIAPHYVNLARSIYQGNGFTTHVIWNNFLGNSQIIRPDFFRLPLYPYLIFLFYRIFGFSFFSVKLVNVFAGSLLPILSFLLTYSLTKSKKIATLLLIFISFNQLLLKWNALPYPEIVYCCCIILLLYFLYKTQKGNIFLYSGLTGVFWGLAYLTRAEALYIFLPVILFFYYFQRNKKQFAYTTIITILCFLATASPYLIRNYKLTKNPFFSDFPKIAMVSYVERSEPNTLIESPTVEYKNIYDLALHHPVRTIKYMADNIIIGLASIPTLLLYGYAITLLAIMGIFYVWRENCLKYNHLFTTIMLGFLIPTLSIGFEDRYFIFLIVIFYCFACIGLFYLYDSKLKNNQIVKSLIIIYLAFFIVLSGITGIGKGTIPYTPHSFYKRFNAGKFYADTQEIYDFIKTNTGQNDVIMVSRRPYGIYYFTERPIVLFPFTDESGVQNFIKKYNVKWLLWMGQPSKIDGKYFKFFLPDEIPNNIVPIFQNTGGYLFKVNSFVE